jgi:hypothetical protein
MRCVSLRVYRPIFTYLNQRQKETREEKVPDVIHANLHLNAVLRAPQWKPLKVMQMRLSGISGGDFVSTFEIQIPKDR